MDGSAMADENMGISMEDVPLAVSLKKRKHPQILGERSTLENVGHQPCYRRIFGEAATVLYCSLLFLYFFRCRKLHLKHT